MDLKAKLGKLFEQNRQNCCSLEDAILEPEMTSGMIDLDISIGWCSPLIKQLNSNLENMVTISKLGTENANKEEMLGKATLSSPFKSGAIDPQLN